MIGLKDYPTGHFEALLTMGCSLAIEQGVPQVEEFLAARLRVQRHLDGPDQGLRLGSLRAPVVAFNQRYTAVSLEPYCDTALVADKVLDPSGANKELRYSYLDLPGVQCDGTLGTLFFTALLSSTDPKILSTEIVQMIIEHSFNDAIYGVVALQILPYIVWQTSFTVWGCVCALPLDLLVTHWEGPEPEVKAYTWGSRLMIVILICAFYFCYFEIRAIMSRGPKIYFYSISTWMNLIPICLSPVLGVLYLIDPFE
jgi:hypothetical protein